MPTVYPAMCLMGRAFLITRRMSTTAVMPT